jgi:hypothetical protein
LGSQWCCLVVAAVTAAQVKLGHIQVMSKSTRSSYIWILSTT